MIKAFTIVVVFAAIFYLYFKIKYWRTSLPIEKSWLQAKTNIAMGVFLAAFGLNLLIFPRSTVDIVVGLTFTILGVINAKLGYNNYTFFLPQVIEEAKQQSSKA